MVAYVFMSMHNIFLINPTMLDKTVEKTRGYTWTYIKFVNY